MANNLIPTTAGTIYAPGLKGRAGNQNDRIQAGIQEGSINGNEMVQLHQQRAELRSQLKADKADNGWVGPQERRDAHQGLNEISASIYGFRH